MSVAETMPIVANSESGGRIRVGFVVGPTGAGKTALAMRVAEYLGAEIVNADSRQIYLGMDIGTAKPSPDERRRVRHHLIDVRTPDKPLDVADFSAIARAAIGDIARRGRPILVVGGSGLYLRALRGGIFAGPPASAEFRARTAALAERSGAGHLHDRLREIDPEAAERIGRNDLYRVTRALEVYELTRETITAHQARHRFASADFETLTVGIAPERKALYETIDRRFDEMMAAGLVAEVRALLDAGYRPDRRPLATIGYKQIAEYLSGKIDLETATENAKRESRRLAKRQMTWFRADSSIVWLDPERAAEQALSRFEEFFGLEESTGTV